MMKPTKGGGEREKEKEREEFRRPLRGGGGGGGRRLPERQKRKWESYRGEERRGDRTEEILCSLSLLALSLLQITVFDR